MDVRVELERKLSTEQLMFLNCGVGEDYESSLELSFLYSPTLTFIHDYLRKNIALTRQTFVGKVMSLLFNMLSRLVITFLPRSKGLFISWLQSPSAVILELPQNKVSYCFHCFSIYLP